MVITEQAKRIVSFVVRLRDDFSKEWGLVGSTKVFLSGSGVTAIKNPSHYHVFTDLKGTAFKVRVENRYYSDQEVDVEITALDPRNPVVTVTMKPTCLYPFPAASTLIRGTVIGPGNNPVDGAEITVDGSTVTNKCEQAGRFVLYIGPLTEDDIVVSGTHRFIRIGTDITLRVRVEHPSYVPRIETIGVVEEGTTKLLSAPITLSS